MLSPREVAASRFTATRGMPRRVLGAGAFELAELRAAKVAALRRALAACEAAIGTSRQTVREWTDDDLQRAADVLAADLGGFAS